MFVNGGGRRFIDGAYALGTDVNLEGRGVAIGDLDQDGALDLVVRSVARKKVIYFHNEVGARNRFLRVDLQGTRSNRDAVGAVVRVVADGLTQTRFRKAGSGFQGQSERTVHFGLGKSRRVTSLDVRWPSGLRERFDDPPVDHVIRIVEGSGRFTARRPRGWRDRPRVAPGPSPSWRAWRLDGRRVAPKKDRPTIVNLWASWCRACKEEVPILNQAHARLRAMADLVGISFDEADAAAAKRFLSSTSPRYPIALSTRAEMSPLLSRAFGDGAVPLPSTIVLDRRGRLVRTFTGSITADGLAKTVSALVRR